jgi:hypothetical protein
MDRTERLAAVVAEVGQIACEGLDQVWDQALEADLGTIEVLVQRLLRRVGGCIVAGLGQARVATLAQVQPCCAGCGGALRRVGVRSRDLVGLVGDARIDRPYYSCAACGVGGAPLDEAWGLDRGALTPGLARVVCRDGLEAPFGQAASLVAEHLGVEVDEELVRRVTERLGALADADQTERSAWQAAQPVPEMLVVELDGGLVHLRAAWHELKVGRVAPLGPALVQDTVSGARHLALGPSCYCAGLEGTDDFWPRLTREALRAGLGRGVKRVVVLADGAEWIWRQARGQLALRGVEVVEILDFYHASQQLAAAAAYGGHSADARAWLDTQCHLLRQQGPRPVLAALADLRARDEAGAEVLRRVHGYVATNAHRMDYPAFQVRLFPIGSGAIESTVKNLVQQRQTLAGMRWTRDGAQTVATLRALHRSVGRWAAFWQTLPLRRAQTMFAPPLRVVPATSETVLAPDPVRDDPPAPAPTATRIQSDGKPWSKGKDFWHRSPFIRKRSA